MAENPLYSPMLTNVMLPTKQTQQAEWAATIEQEHQLCVCVLRLRVGALAWKS